MFKKAALSFVVSLGCLSHLALGTKFPADCECDPSRSQKANDILFALVDAADGNSGGDKDRLGFDKKEICTCYDKLGAMFETTFECCCDSKNAEGCKDVTGKKKEARPLRMVGENDGPWITPNSPEATMLASDPGIWEIQDFLGDDLLERVIAAVKRAEDDPEVFGYCGPAHGPQSKCAELSASSPISPEDQAVFAEVKDKVNALWPNELDQRDWFYVQRMRSGGFPTKMHLDSSESGVATVSSVIYLSDADAATVFADINVTVKPEKGKIATWLNVHEDGIPNHASSHGIQAIPEGGADRLAMAYAIYYPFPSEDAAIV